MAKAGCMNTMKKIKNLNIRDSIIVVDLMSCFLGMP